ncbi:hypothetical protein BVY01_05225 [bacterium I07]|nr:hypothetical protein BVY01_05225 [bacterium I07]
MAALYQKLGSDIFYVTYVFHGKRCRKSTKTSDRKLAELFLKDLEVRIARDNLGFSEMNRKEVRLSAFIKDYLNHSEAEKADKTFEIDTRALKGFRDLHGDLHLSKVNLKHGEDFRIKRMQKVKPVSVNMEIRQLKAAFEKAVKWSYIERNPFKDLKQCKVKNSNIPKFLSKGEVRKLLDVIEDEQFKAYVQFLLYTGCRRSEALNLTWQEIDMDKGLVTFQVTKTGKSRTIPFNETLKTVLNQLDRISNRPFNFRKDFVTHKFKKYLRRTGINNCESLKLHSLRHTFASHLVMSGVDLLTVSKLLGHCNVSMTEIYAHLMPDHMKASIERLHY